MLVAAVILTLYFWVYFADVQSIGASLLIGDDAAIMAALAFAIGLVSYLWAPKTYSFFGTITAFGVLCATSAVLILNTGDTSSPFIALWMLVSVFAGVFGLYGILPLFAALIIYLIAHFFDGSLTREAVLTVVLAGELPLAMSYLIWHTKTKSEPATDRAYRELATELSQVASESEVVINAIADGVIALNNRGVIQLINPAAQQIIGWGKQDALGLDYKSVLKLSDKTDADLAPATDPISQALATNKEVTTDDLHLMTNSGKRLLVSVTVSPVGQLGAGVIIVFRDITKEKTEERGQAEFISTASHEMRTPVASIEGYLGLALNPNTAQIDEKAREFITKAHESAQHLGRLFQDLLDISKAEDGRLTNNPKVVDVVAFTHDIFEGLKPKGTAKALRMVFKPLPDEEAEKSGERRLNPVFYVNVDNDHLREVISNLIENAIKYTPKGEVVVDVTGNDERVTVSVADSGIGIPKEDMGHLFQKFYRVDNTDTREIGGTGLGLYLCRRLTEAMNGRIWVESEYKQGSTFYVELPRIEHEEATRLIEAASLNAEQADETKQTFTPVYQITPPSSSITPTPPPVSTPPPSPEEQLPQPGESVYTNTPVEAVVTQLHSLESPPSTLPPAAPLSPQPPSPPRQQLYSESLRVPRVNTPLSSIEQDPSHYLRPRPRGPVPPRDQNKP